MWLFIVLIAVPIIEIALFIEVGGLIGTWPTVGIVIVTAIVGAWLLRTQGRGALMNLQREFAQGGDPRGPLAHGAMIVFAGALLLTPGFFTDAIGLLLLTPPVRSAIIAWAGPRLAARATFTTAGFGAGPQQGGPDRAPDPQEDVIDVDFEPLDDTQPRGRSGWTRESD